MIIRHKAVQGTFMLLVLLGIVWGYSGCNKDTPALAPYIPGDVTLSQISVEDSVYVPLVSWVGGYVGALGVNQGSTSRIDTSLLWLIHESGNALHYQQRFGQTPGGAQDLTTQYGGHSVSALQEDRVYTFWVAKDDAWTAIAAHPGWVLLVDSLDAQLSRESGDTLYLNRHSFTLKVDTIDLYISIRNVSSFGKLGTINVIATNTDNSPIIQFQVTEAGVPDTLVANIGICSGTAYDVGSVVWEALGVDSSTTPPTYWTTDPISSPVKLGQYLPGTQVFTAYPPTGLTRNVSYYLWIANRIWDQRTRARFATNYAYVLFDTY